MQLAAGALFAAIVAVTAGRAGALTRGGALAAFAVGTIVFGARGWTGAAVLFAFFLPAVLLSRLGRTRKDELRDVGKQGPRDACQVLANGGVAALCALLALRFGARFDAGLAGAFAAASADTWGTEIGTLVRSRAISILTLRPIPVGLSGGMTLPGNVATLCGAAFVAAVATLSGVAPFIPVAAGGVAGALLDSILGAGAQALRRCPSCRCDCETNPHHCGSPTILRRGFAWLENDAVNLAATLCGALVAGYGSIVMAGLFH